MIETASDGHYAEAWTLPNGLTYRVTGRPHPDGAIAFLIEDITDEISFSRRTKSQLEIRQAVLDRQPDQPGDVPITYADVSRAERELGYRCTTPLADGVQKFCRWYVDEKAAQRVL